MENSLRPLSPIKSALFVDFDNIYIGLSKTDPLAAERFASDPARWLNWLEKGLPNRSGDKNGPVRQRSILIRRCYPNPDAGFRRFRSYFTSAAFSVIDCPSLTRMGKNSSDIYMVMDILDILNHKTFFDEFIIFSGDSDFMPVLLRLRAHDRRTTTLAIDFMPPAYKAACDLVISEEEFIEDALGLSHDSSCGGAARARVPMHLLKEMALRVYEAACDGDGEVAGASLPEILKDFREFRESNNWLGFGTSQRLAEALACSEPRLNLVRLSPTMYKIVLKPGQPVVGVQNAGVTPLQPALASGSAAGRVSNETINAGKPLEKPAAETAPAEKAPQVIRPEYSRLRSQIVSIVRDMVSHSPSALLLARVSQYVVNRLGPQVLESQWAGSGSFKRLLQSVDDLDLEITTQPEPGYIFDPKRHPHPANRASNEEDDAFAASGVRALSQREDNEAAGRSDMDGVDFETEGQFALLDARGMVDNDYPLEDLHLHYGDDEESEDEEEEDAYGESLPDLDEFILRVSRVTGAPDLTPEQYAIVFRGMVHELQQIARGEKSYNTYQSSKAVSDWCAEQGNPVSRGDIVLVFKGIIFQDGVRFGKRPGSYTEQELAVVVRNNIKALCRRSRLELSEYEERLLDEWILGGLEDPGELEFTNEEQDAS